MDNKKFKIYNRISAVFAFVVALITYLATIEPSASFWDCGEFIASSYKLEVGHPPGNPVFQLFGRLFTMFTDAAHAAVAVNVMSALCSALTIFFLYLTIVFLAKRLVPKGEDGLRSTAGAITIFASGLVGSLAYCFSDTFWFSAVEGEVYGMSSLFTAMVFWAMTRWYECADEPHSSKWIVLISLLMGLSIGVHLLNLLTIPCLVFMFYYRRREDGNYTALDYLKIFLISVVILALILFFVIPYLPKIAAYFDLFFVNVLHLPYNTGAAVFMAVLLYLLFRGILTTYDKGKVFWNTALLCLTTIVIGFSIFTICIIRSSVKTPTNEYQPDNPFTLVRYLAREQYGSNPLIYGQYFDAPYEIEDNTYWAPLGGKYVKVKGPGKVVYKSSGKMLFPRMWDSSNPRSVDFYEIYTGGKGQKVAGADHRKPTFGANMLYFLDYQLNWMYWRYFMWNFVGRQNEICATTPGDNFAGNWESGIGFLDNIRLGDQSDAPDYLASNRAKNHYFFLPLLLGLIGLFWQFSGDRRGCWLTFLLFFMTGIAIVMYLNQPPFQVRERDYAYAGSFYAFCIWIGLSVLAIYGWVENFFKSEGAKRCAASCAGLLCLGVPALMACQNWDDHDRSGRATAVELAYNYLNSVGPGGILVTHGDNDTFPLWYAQEVEGIRTDVRICNTSLLGTDWHIDQMKYACNESAPLNLQVPLEQYLYGTNEWVPIYDTRDTVMPLSTVMKIFRHPQAKLSYGGGLKCDYIASRKFSIPVNKENCIKYGIVPQKYADLIPDEIVLTLPKNKNYLSKPELFTLDLLSGYEWDRPLNFLAMGGDINVGIKEYFMYQGYSYKFVPIKNSMSSSKVGFCDPDEIYNLMTGVFKFDALKRPGYLVDHQNLFTFCGVMSHRLLFVNAAKEMIKAGRKDRAEELLDLCMESVPECNFPLDISYVKTSNEYMILEIVRLYYMVGASEKARDLAVRFLDKMMQTNLFWLEFYDLAEDDFKTSAGIVYYAADILTEYGDKETADAYEGRLKSLIKTASSLYTESN
ncbi:MAG: DUF2723 domain-containing protein [Bacteroidales bacterium]|nr:DUF2723 domain-containing protein [Bacteroidales bacterium]